MKDFNIDYKGKRYTSFETLETATGISRNTLRARWYGGKRTSQEMTAQPEPSARGKQRAISETYNGKVYKSLGLLADEAGLSRQLIYTRYNRGKRIETGLLDPKRVTKKGDDAHE